MNTYTFAPMRQRIREAVIDFGLTRRSTHWLTLNCHRCIGRELALKHLRRWRVEILRRLYGRRFYALPEDNCFNFFGGLHLAAYDEPHFHLACFIPEAALEKFMYHGPLRWKAIVPSGTLHIERLDESVDTPRRLLAYALRVFDQTSDLSFVDSRLLH